MRMRWCFRTVESLVSMQRRSALKKKMVSLALKNKNGTWLNPHDAFVSYTALFTGNVCCKNAGTVRAHRGVFRLTDQPINRSSLCLLRSLGTSSLD